MTASHLPATALQLWSTMTSLRCSNVHDLLQGAPHHSFTPACKCSAAVVHYDLPGLQQPADTPATSTALKLHTSMQMQLWSTVACLGCSSVEIPLQTALQ